MTEQAPHKTFICSLCSYTTYKKYNLERHIALVHNLNAPNINIMAPKVNSEAPFINTMAPIINATSPKVNTIKCEKCYQTFSRKAYLKRHLDLGRCKEMPTPLTCEKCAKVLGSSPALSRHRKTCKGSYRELLQADPECGSTSTNIGVQNNNSIQTQNIVSGNQTNVTNNNILVFPMTETESDKFDFVTDHITLAKLKDCIVQRPSRVGFNRFISHVLQNPQNRNVQKTNMKDKYSKVHIGDNHWELALDADVYPTMTHHMTTAALGKMEEHRKQIPQSIRTKAQELIKYIDYINTTDEGEIYNETVERLKLVIVNLCNM